MIKVEKNELFDFFIKYLESHKYFKTKNIAYDFLSKKGRLFTDENITSLAGSLSGVIRVIGRLNKEKYTFETNNRNKIFKSEINLIKSLKKYEKLDFSFCNMREITNDNVDDYLSNCFKCEIFNTDYNNIHSITPFDGINSDPRFRELWNTPIVRVNNIEPEKEPESFFDWLFNY